MKKNDENTKADSDCQERLVRLCGELGIKSCARIYGSNWWHIRGKGPCNFAQLPPSMPVHPSQLDDYTFHEAGDEFRANLRRLNEAWPNVENENRTWKFSLHGQSYFVENA